LLCPKNIPNALTGFGVNLIPPILYLPFFSLPIHIPSILFRLTLKMTQIFLFHSWLTCRNTIVWSRYHENYIFLGLLRFWRKSDHTQ
jgi:hypothetical protein